jgi:hypothetical protein
MLKVIRRRRHIGIWIERPNPGLKLLSNKDKRYRRRLPINPTQAESLYDFRPICIVPLFRKRNAMV